ncbi:nucleotide-diphospho-sugar transferase [Desertivirga arenae]|uniref:nucleotide-diphospho-sugar transferase n=1 Tax=Desertivirga arenae TaxID=2810309 RepID=UPI001A96DF0E|nr:nucleotide-diphospho-sugar transferase [Pedobacter sp. SYSU D00823]
MGYYTQSPVLLLVFNRPDLAKKVFEKIRESRPKKLYVAADGPRENNEEDAELCNESKNIIEQVDWECEVQTLFRPKNMGCKIAVSSAISWFFQCEEEGIVLEDDCLPSNDFFRFADLLLDKYRNDTRIGMITGCNLQRGKTWGSGSYYFSKNTHVWGWASWRRSWKDYDESLSNYKEGEVHEQFFKVFGNTILAQDWTLILKKLKAGLIDTWDYQFSILNYFNNRLTAVPNENLISNIGYGPRGTHTIVPDDPNANIPLGAMSDNIIHPRFILPEPEADWAVWEKEFEITRRRKKAFKKKLKDKFGLTLIQSLLKNKKAEYAGD